MSVPRAAFLAGIPGIGYATQTVLPNGLQECRGMFTPDISRDRELAERVVLALEPVEFAGTVYTDVGERRATFPVISSADISGGENTSTRTVVRFVATGDPFAHA